MAMQCDNGDAALAEKACAAEELKYYKSQVDPEDRTVLQRTTAEEKETFKERTAQRRRWIVDPSGGSTTPVRVNELAMRSERALAFARKREPS